MLPQTAMPQRPVGLAAERENAVQSITSDLSTMTD